MASDNKIKGLHHITAIATEAQVNYDFYTRILGLRLVKKTVNFDDPGTYHFYYGNEVGAPGTILTFFPWTGIQQGKVGTGMASEIGYAVPQGSLHAWEDWFKQHNVKYGAIGERFGQKILPFQDPDGLLLNLIEVEDERLPWTTDKIPAQQATRGFHSITLSLQSAKPTINILENIFGYTFEKQEGELYRYRTDAIETANVVDIRELPNEKHGIVAGGTNHHVAFRVENEEVLMHFREKILSKGLSITPKIDRNYFYSLYFREPGGVLFELATDNPGFAVDEPVNELGQHLKLPAQYEPQRSDIEQVLPKLIQ
ncbi:glyoxalase family protein [Chitinophaga skermanii]|uniref:Glyoxalase family protein n=1 Tax=Chitinophaga skermanii TaxID=331697 RepID=A0A327R5L3_9BACT|nr:ring-cleaving dioxygenase [Chitinophaga skermanii]RAJ10883.1 glyoxalase family protein [Chitinophaga skermanii]